MIGLEGLTLTDDERCWLRDMPPRGVILFSRNIESPEQVTALLSEVRGIAGKDTWAAIDEEGGRVNRIPWPPFSNRLHGADYGTMYRRNAGTAIQAVFQDSLSVAEALKPLGFTHNCAPVLDVFSTSGHSIIGARAYADDVNCVSALATACMRGLEESGIAAIGKHFPGHGRADADSHVDVPRVDVSLDILLDEAGAFAELIGEGLGHLMTAHVIYTRVEQRVATLSHYWLGDVLRQRFGFRGLVWSDDLCMKGVGENVPQAARAAEAAGCDILLVCQPEGVRAMYESLQDMS